LDESAVGRIVDHLCAGAVQGVFVLGTTGEASAIPRDPRERLVQLTLERVRNRALVYAGISANSLPESVTAGNKYLREGVDAVVAHVPGHFARRPEAASAFYAGLASQLEGNLILYNIPLTTQVSLPIELCKATAHLPRVIGIKDSENDPARMANCCANWAERKFFGVHWHRRADGERPVVGRGWIVPSVGNLAPALCRALYDRAFRGDAAGAEQVHQQLMELSRLYQKDVSLDALARGAQGGHGVARAVWRRYVAAAQTG